MVALDHQKVAGLVGVLQHIHVEAPHESIPGLVVGELGGPIFELVQVITKISNDTGRVLQSGGYPDLGTFLLEASKKAKGGPDIVLQQVSTIPLGSDATGSSNSAQLVRGIPAFRDMAVVDGHGGLLLLGHLLCFPDIRSDRHLSRTAIYTFKKALPMIHLVNLRFLLSPHDFVVLDSLKLPISTGTK